MNNKNEKESTSGSKSVCKNHPAVETEFKCLKCGTYICKTCVFPQPDGTSICPDCMQKPVTTETGPPAPSICEGTMCSIHPGVPAVQICQMCGTSICKTCDFEFPDNLHVCPNCINKPQTLSSKQKKYLVWSYVLAGVATIGFILSLFISVANQSKGMDMVIGLFFIIFALAPAIVGLSLGTSSRSRHQKKPVSLWIALIWNGILIGLYLILVIVGNLME